MNRWPSSLRRKTVQLRATFAAQLPARLAEARRCFDLIKGGCHDQDTVAPLHLMLHSIKGTGNSLGYAEIGAIAARAEHLSQLLFEKFTAADELLLEMEQCLAQIGGAVANVEQFDARFRDSAPAPSFEMPALRPSTAARSDKLCTYATTIPCNWPWWPASCTVSAIRPCCSTIRKTCCRRCRKNSRPC